MSCMLGVSPRPLTSSPFSVSAVCLVMLLLALFSSVRFLAMTVPLAFCQGPEPTRSRALTAPAPCVLRYACQVLPPAPAACARSEEHTSELQSRELISYAVFCLNKNIRQGLFLFSGYPGSASMDDLRMLRV